MEWPPADRRRYHPSLSSGVVTHQRRTPRGDEPLPSVAVNGALAVAQHAAAPIVQHRAHLGDHRQWPKAAATRINSIIEQVCAKQKCRSGTALTYIVEALRAGSQRTASNKRI